MHKMGKSNVLMEVGENIAEITDNIKKAMKKKQNQKIGAF